MVHQGGRAVERELVRMERIFFVTPIQGNDDEVCPQIPHKGNGDLNPEEGHRNVPGEANTGSGGANN